MLYPKPLELRTAAGDEKTFVLHKFPATVGREIVAKYPVANLPKRTSASRSRAVTSR
jgi:hypothetical protein